MDDILYFVRHPEEAEALAIALERVAGLVRQARTLSDIDSIRNQLVLVDRTLERRIERLEAALIQFMADQVKQPCAFHEYAYSKGCAHCREKTGVRLDGTPLGVSNG